MTRSEYTSISNKEFKEKFGYSKWKHYNEARVFWKEVIDEMKIKRPGVNIQLHHFKLNDLNYEKWEVIPLYEDEHLAFHGRTKSKEHQEKRLMRW